MIKAVAESMLAALRDSVAKTNEAGRYADAE
jgi:hypothetical protein